MYVQTRCCIDAAPDQHPSTIRMRRGRGWRRSGTYVYKPRHRETCCQLLTIRQRSPDFVPSKSQRRLLAKWEAISHTGLVRRPGRAEQGAAGGPTRKRAKREIGTSDVADGGDRDAERMASAVAEAAARAVCTLGALDPGLALPAPVLRPPTAKQRQAMGLAVICCSAYPLQLRGWLHRSHGLDVSAEDVARALQEALVLEGGVSCRSSDGWLNFFCGESDGGGAVEVGRRAGRNKESS